MKTKSLLDKKEESVGMYLLRITVTFVLLFVGILGIGAADPDPDVEMSFIESTVVFWELKIVGCAAIYLACLINKKHINEK